MFLGSATQWVMAESRPVGLRYEALPILMKCHGVKKKDRPDMLTDIKHCERVALECWRRRRG